MKLLEVRIYGINYVMAISPNLIRNLIDMNIEKLKEAGYEVTIKDDKIIIKDPETNFTITYTPFHPTVRKKLIRFTIGNVELVLLNEEEG